MSPSISGFIRADLDASRWDEIEPLLDQLLTRPISSAADLEKWILDRSDLDAACSEARADLYIHLTCNTDSADANEAYSKYVESVQPRLKPKAFELDKRLVALEKKFHLPPERYEVMLRSKRTAVEIFREENIPLQTEATKLVQDFDRLIGAQTVQFDGTERTLAQMGVYLELPDREVREGAWRTINDRRMRDREALNDIFDRLVSLRDLTARNTALPTYVEYGFKERERFDYTPEDCAAYWDGVRSHVVPFIRRIDERRRRTMGVDILRPWDLSVDPRGRAALRPFEGGRQLVAKTQGVFKRLDPRLAGMFNDLVGGATTSGDAGGVRTECLDLDSRKGKRPGGYQYMRDRVRKPFIFMNAAGLQRDVMTMLHEAGHAFHSQLCAGEPLLEYRHYPTEFAEVASMSMEHVTMPHWGGAEGFYTNEEDLGRARRVHIEDSISILAWIAIIDSFQHWIFRNPGHSRQQREARWLELDSQFGRGVSWSGLEEFHRNSWQRQSHIFSHPLYYIEYGIAQLGALQLWLKGKTEGERAAVDAYINALRLGGSRPLPELFEAAGLRFDFGGETLKRVVGAVEEELEKLPE
jgi:oligoendopeptidase F